MHTKMFYLISLLLMTGIAANAQFKKGGRMAGTTIGSAFYNSGSSDVADPAITNGLTSKNTSFGLSFIPSLGWFVSDNTAIGATLNINPTGNKTTYTAESNGNLYQQDKLNGFNFGIGGFARNYFNTSSSFMPFGQLSLNLGMSTKTSSGFFYGGSGASAYKTTYSGKSSGGFFSNASLALGMTKLLNPNTGLDFYTGYSFSYTKNTFKTNSTRDDGNNGTIDQTGVSNLITKFTNHGFTLGVGFQIFLDRKK
jgi:hypothetical protein